MVQKSFWDFVPEVEAISCLKKPKKLNIKVYFTLIKVGLYNVYENINSSDYKNKISHSSGERPKQSAYKASLCVLPM